MNVVDGSCNEEVLRSYWEQGGVEETDEGDAVMNEGNKSSITSVTRTCSLRWSLLLG